MVTPLPLVEKSYAIVLSRSLIRYRFP